MDIINKILDKKPKKILIQAPEGLRKNALELSEKLEEKDIQVFISADPCYGSCGIADHEAVMLGADLIVHMGHNKFYKDFPTQVPVLYYPFEIDICIDKVDFSVIKEEKIGLISPIQYIHLLDNVAETLKKIGKKPVIGGQILGCWTKNAEKISADVDAFLCISSGSFHPFAISGKKVYVLDSETLSISIFDSNELEKKKYAKIYKAKDAKTFGIILSSKQGQFAPEKAEIAKQYLTKKGKKIFILIMDDITDEKLVSTRIDAFINTACPRILDNKFSKPVINFEDLEKI